MSEPNGRPLLLVVTPSRDDWAEHAEALAEAGYDMKFVTEIAEAESVFERTPVAALLLDVEDLTEAAMELLEELSERRVAPPVVLAGGQDGTAALAATYGLTRVSRGSSPAALRSLVADAIASRRRPLSRERRASASKIRRIG